MDGYVRTHRFSNGLGYHGNEGYYGQFKTPKDSAELIVIVENWYLTVLVNGEIVVQYDDASLQRGNLALSLASGTNKDFGTKCTMTNIDFWDIQ